ncbi:MAG: hypothetical protein P8X80_12675 [Desulfobacterales bacterium]
MHEIIIGKFADADIAASIVWIPILDDDSVETALPSVKYLNDKRFRHFYDQDQIVGKEIAKRVGWDGHVAWDMDASIKRQLGSQGTFSQGRRPG